MSNIVLPLNQPFDIELSSVSDEDLQEIFDQLETLGSNPLKVPFALQNNQQLIMQIPQQEHQMQGSSQLQEQLSTQKQLQHVQFLQPPTVATIEASSAILNQQTTDANGVFRIQQHHGNLVYCQPVSHCQLGISETYLPAQFVKNSSSLYLPSTFSVNQNSAPQTGHTTSQMPNINEQLFRQEASDDLFLRRPQQPLEDTEYYSQPPSVQSFSCNSPTTEVDNQEITVSFGIQNNIINLKDDAKYLNANEQQQLTKLLYTLLQRKESDVAGQRQKHLDDALKEDCNNLRVSKLRSYITDFMKALYLSDDDKNKSKVKHLWENRPADWPKEVPFIDPNNGNKLAKEKKPSKPDLLLMFKYLSERYKHKLQQKISSIVVSSQSDHYFTNTVSEIYTSCQPTDNNINETVSFLCDNKMEVDEDISGYLNCSSVIVQPPNESDMQHFGFQSSLDPVNVVLKNVIKNREWTEHTSNENEEKKSIDDKFHDLWQSFDKDILLLNDGSNNVSTPPVNNSFQTAVQTPVPQMYTLPNKTNFMGIESYAFEVFPELFSHDLPKSIPLTNTVVDQPSGKIFLTGNPAMYRVPEQTAMPTKFSNQMHSLPFQRESAQHKNHQEQSEQMWIPTVVEKFFENNSKIETNMKGKKGGRKTLLIT